MAVPSGAAALTVTSMPSCSFPAAMLIVPVAGSMLTPGPATLKVSVPVKSGIAFKSCSPRSSEWIGGVGTAAPDRRARPALRLDAGAEGEGQDRYQRPRIPPAVRGRQHAPDPKRQQACPPAR